LSYKLKAKIWLEKDRKKVFGDGPVDILKRVERTGSLRQAAAEIKMSYSQAWHLIKMLEANLGFPILEMKAGGTGGGSSSLTPEAAALTTAYSAFRKESHEALEDLFRKHFSYLDNH